MAKRPAPTTPPPTTKRTRGTAGPKPSSVRDIAEKALKLAVAANKGIERKNVDFSGNSTIGTTATALHFTAVAQGAGGSQRVGNSIYVTGLAMNYYWYKHPTSTQVQIRLVIVMDTQTQSDDTALSWTEVFESSSIMSMVNKGSQKNRFKILYDKIGMIDTSDFGQTHQKVFIPIKKQIDYNGSASSDIQRNGIYGLILSDENTNQPAFNYYSRLYFQDS